MRKRTLNRKIQQMLADRNSSTLELHAMINLMTQDIGRFVINQRRLGRTSDARWTSQALADIRAKQRAV